MPELRRQHRISYQTKVRLRAPGREESVVARVQNLSPRGIFVTAPDIPEAGTEVQCKLTIAGERRTLRGRVAWVRPASAAAPLKSPGAGIEFLELGDADRDLLGRVVEPAEGERQPVDVWFEGMRAPVRCQAVVTEGGLRLATRLPFMRLNSSVRVNFSQQGVEQVRVGTLDAVALDPSDEEGMPHLQLTVSVPPPDSAQGTIEVAPPARAHTPTASAIVGEPSTVVDPAVAAPAPAQAAGVSDREQTQRVPMPHRPAPALPSAPKAPPLAAPTPTPTPAPMRSWQMAGLGFLAGALVFGIGSLVLRPRTEPTPALVSLAARATPPAPAPAPRVNIEPLGAAAAPAAAVVPPAASTPAPAPPTAEAAPVAAEPAAPPAVAPPPAEAPAAEDDRGAPAPAAAGGVAAEVEGDTATVTLPLAGTPKNAQHYPLASPPGVAVALPRARPRATAGVYRPGEGFRQVAIMLRRGGGSQVRFLFDPNVYTADVRFEREAVKLVLKKK
jgi:Tfp pilus assembly protein PilZ